MKSGNLPAGGPKVARIVIADDHDLSRAGLLYTLASEPDLEVVGEAASGTEAVVVCQRLLPDLVLIDVQMPKMDGLEATHEIKWALPRISVVMVTMYENPDYLFEALKAGAAGYILKDATHEELLGAVRKVLDGETLLSPALANKLLKKLVGEHNERPTAIGDLSHSSSPPKRRPSSPHDSLLTPREVEILGFMARGQTNRQIAKRLVVSAGTVQSHVHHIIAKLAVSDRTQAAVQAILLGLITLD
jgi:DNA-binding NarL/FixJ family response regulator